MSFAIEDLKLFVPDLWKKPWNEWIAEADGIDRDFVSAGAYFARTLRRIPTEAPTPERLAWLALWSRLFGALTGARGAAQWESRFAVGVMHRVATEVVLHVQAIALPALEGVEMPTPVLDDNTWAGVRKRLCAYLAWGIFGDEQLCRHVLDDKKLDLIYDPKPQRAFIERLGPMRESWERLSGQELELVSDAEAFQDRTRARTRLVNDLNRLTKWSSDRRIAPWIAKLKALARSNRDSKKGAVTLFQLLDLPASVPQFMNRRGTSIGYVGYLQGSGFVHGSSLDSSMLAVDGVVAPDFANLGNGFESTTRAVLAECRLGLIMLELMSMHLDDSGG